VTQRNRSFSDASCPFPTVDHAEEATAAFVVPQDADGDGVDAGWRNIQVAMPPIAARIKAYCESDAGAGVKLSNTSRHAIAPMRPIAPIVCMNFINRRMASIR